MAGKSGKKTRSRFPELVVSIFICLLAGVLGAIFTTSAIPTWYAALKKPFFSPPNWLFGPVWTLLYLMMGVSLYLVWISPPKAHKTKTLSLFGIQLFLNFLWSFLFFGMRSPLLAFAGIIALWVFILLTILSFRKISRTASLLLLPYLFWVTFAAILNFSIVLLNGG
jgi:benzodiazapine receptor